MKPKSKKQRARVQVGIRFERSLHQALSRLAGGRDKVPALLRRLAHEYAMGGLEVPGDAKYREQQFRENGQLSQRVTATS